MTRSETGSTWTPWLFCRIGGSACALPLEQVVEVLRPLTITPMADAPEPVLGLSIIRGTPLPVVDIGVLLGAREARPGRMVVMNTGPRRVALLAETVIGVRAVMEDSHTALPPLLQDAAGHLIRGIGERDGEFLLLLRMARLLPESWPGEIP